MGQQTHRPDHAQQKQGNPQSHQESQPIVADIGGAYLPGRPQRKTAQYELIRQRTSSLRGHLFL